ncbi:ShlB/FhaC/HecB family hemolysin secretion/activation protein, partial [Tychonema sp. LEGE 07199]|nr:ShlB/FhaC/HecB family hemolysin secretion/activation protein [Tychonema sp. LEGE 07199]
MVNLQSQAEDKLILQKTLIMRPRANIAIFRLGISLLTALPIACFYTNKAISQTNDISQFSAADNSANTDNEALALQKLEIQQDETATNLNQLPDFPESSPIENQPDRCSTINQTDCDTRLSPEAKNFADSQPKCHNPLDCNVVAQNQPQTPPN